MLLNKGDAAADFEVSDYLQAGRWRGAIGGNVVEVAPGGSLSATVPAHGVEVYLLDAPVTRPDLQAELARLMAGARRGD